MLTASRLKLREGTSTPTLIGASSGKRILCSKAALPKYNNLVSLAQRGNYWATLVVRAIASLNAGRLHQDNIYIDERKSVAYGKGAFHVVLPGVTASLEEWSDGKYILQSLSVNHEYQQMQAAQQRPGLWQVSHKPELQPNFLSDGKVTKKDMRPVVIADRSGNDLEQIIGATRESLLDHPPTGGMTAAYGYDLHFTPGDGSIMGLKKAKYALSSNRDREIVRSATLLANTMYMAREQKGVIWFSDFGGSAILTRALQILQQQPSVSLKHHSIFFNHPTSMTKEAVVAAEALELKAVDKKSGILNPKEFIGHFTFTDTPLKKAAAVATLGVTTAGAAFGLAGASLTTAGVIGVAGGLLTVKDAIVSGVKNTRFQKY